MAAAGFTPKRAVEPVVKSVPKIEIISPPAVEPPSTLSELMLGWEMNANGTMSVLLPHAALTTTFPSDTGLIGAVVDMDVSLLTVNEAGRPPKVTVVAPVKPVPVMMTAVEPSAAPTCVDSEVTTGRHKPVVKVNASLNVVVPLGLVTAIAAAPALPDGVTKVSWVSLTTFTLVAADPPTVTPEVPVKLEPDSVMVVPPTVDPLTGDSEFMVGATLNVRA
jgi:hypothetical protein